VKLSNIARAFNEEIISCGVVKIRKDTVIGVDLSGISKDYAKKCLI